MILANNLTDGKLKDALPFFLPPIKKAHSIYAAMSDDSPIKHFSSTCFKDHYGHWNSSILLYMATEVDPACGNQGGTSTDPARRNQDEYNAALGFPSIHTNGPSQSNVSAPVASSQSSTVGSQSTSPKTDPTNISTVTSASTVLTSQVDVVPTKKQKPDGPTVISVTSDVSTVDDQKHDVPSFHPKVDLPKL